MESLNIIKKFSWHVVLHTIGIIGLLIVVVCFNTCYRPGQRDYDKLHTLCDSVISNNESLSKSLKYDLSKDKTIKSDSLKSYVVESQKKINLLIGENQLLSARLEEVVNDIRQETNNNICNLNLWLAFAVCLLSLVGVVIPVAMQFKLSADSKKEFEDLKKEFEDSKKEFEDLKIRLEDEYSEMRLKSEVVQSMSTLVNGFDNKVWAEYSNRDKMVEAIWSYSISYFVKYSDYLLKCQNDSDKLCREKVILLEVLIHINTFIYKLRMTNRYKDKKLAKVFDSIRVLINKLNNKSDAYLNTQDFKDYLKIIKEGVGEIDFTKIAKTK